MFDCTIREKKKEKKMYTLSKSLILILANNSADFNNFLLALLEQY